MEFDPEAIQLPSQPSKIYLIEYFGDNIYQGDDKYYWPADENNEKIPYPWTSGYSISNIYPQDASLTKENTISSIQLVWQWEAYYYNPNHQEYHPSAKTRFADTSG